MADFKNELRQSFDEETFVGLVLSTKRDKGNDLKSLSAKIVHIKKGLCLSCVYRYETNDITKNFDLDEAVGVIVGHLETDFRQAELKTTTADWLLMISKDGTMKLKQKKASQSETPNQSHDKNKKRLIPSDGNIYLRELGITDSDWKVKKTMQDKYKQLNKYIEIIESIVTSIDFPADYKVVDMGAGKGYLTFALYDYLSNTLKHQPQICGVELRKNLVDLSNTVAQKAGFDKLNFVQGSIQNFNQDGIDLLIALHACDTATDDAIYKGIQSQAKVIICAPCCHKQVRKAMDTSGDLALISQHGILQERQAELLTDGIRALLMEAHGYKTKVFEFIQTEHTPKNVLIVGIRDDAFESADEKLLVKIQSIKDTYGIRSHYLEDLLAIP
ncbi:MAG: SAM-dependent methyltransferase [Lentisphaeria bacterium]|nr:SAM-dependent methyltransferase [Lentisphaeria bacterium]NQZ67490.1 SAM-dependent methyltransferase [Lentisphaeria bacterium]